MYVLGEKEVLLGYREGDSVRFLSIAKKSKRQNSTRRYILKI